MPDLFNASFEASPPVFGAGRDRPSMLPARGALAAGTPRSARADGLLFAVLPDAEMRRASPGRAASQIGHGLTGKPLKRNIYVTPFHIGDRSTRRPGSSSP